MTRRSLVGVASLLAAFGCSTTEPETKPGPVERSPDECAATTPRTLERVTCLEAYVKALTLRTSAREAMCRAQDLALDGVVDDCHWLAHTIGEASLEKSRGDVGAAFAACPLGCSEGCYHGVVSSWLSGRDRSTVAQDLLTVCSPFAAGSLMRRQCIHGVGHGLLLNPGMTLTSAVSACRSSSDPTFVDVCLGGVFMENARTLSGYPTAQLLERLPALCEGLAPGDIDMCVVAIGEGLVFYTGHDLPKAIALCRGVEPAYRAACEQGANDEAEVPREQRCQ